MITESPKPSANIVISIAALSAAGTYIGIEFNDAMHERIYKEIRSQFYYGEEVFFRVHRWPLSLHITGTASDGEFTRQADHTLTHTETITFAGGPTAQLTYPALEGSFRFTWLGRPLPGALSCKGRTVRAEGLAGVSPVAAAEVTYRMTYQRWRLVVPEREKPQWPVALLLEGEEARA